MEGIRYDVMGWDGYEGAWVGKRYWNWVRRVWDWCGGPRAGVNGQGKVWMFKDGYRRPEMGVKGFGWV